MEQMFLTNSDCYKAGTTINAKGIMVHSTGCNQVYTSVFTNAWNKPDVDVCVHAIIGKDKDGSMHTVQTLPWNRKGWHSGPGAPGKVSANNTHISFEICEDDLTSEKYFNDCYKMAVDLCAYLCEMCGFDPLTDIICHSEGHAMGIASNHADVMHWFPKFGKSMDTFRKDVKTAMETKGSVPSDFAKEAAEWAVNNGYITGYDDGDMGWQDPVTREQVAVILYRALGGG